ncbi:MAG: S46 family peptidase [Flavobacteriaceae bacterium]|nr:S46 family peptidase [Flavobacteriaceae bacterium]
MKLLKVLLLFICVNVSAQQGGMWIPSLLKGMNETEMQSLGSKLSADDIYNVNNSSLKDAIVHFNGGCTAEIISPKGLLLTNHHCGFGQIQSHSSVEEDYLKDGFWAMSLDEELPNKNLEVTFIISIEDVTKTVLNGVSDDMSPKETQSLIQKNTNGLQKSFKKKEWQSTKVKAFFKGNQYFLFVTESFEDIRLVGAPPSAIGKFGSDTDNWIFPRHTGDFSMFRIYADKNNRPAKYSKDNVPYVPKHFLPISLDGIEEGDFTMVFGFPGRTNEYLPAVAVEQITQKVNPTNIKIREEALKVIDAAMKTDDRTRIQYASKQASIANYWKKWIGENQGIEKSNAIAKKRTFETTFTKAISKNKYKKYQTLLSDFDTLYGEFESYAVKRSNFFEIFYRNNELMQTMFRLYQFEQRVEKEKLKLSKDETKGATAEKLKEIHDTEGYKKAKEYVISQITRIQKNYNANVDKGVFEAIMPLYDAKNTNSDFYNTTSFTNLTDALKVLEGTSDNVITAINNDAAYKFAKPYIAEFYNDLEPNYQRINGEIAKVQKQYMKALMEVLPSDRYYPDANSTLRVTYGQVKGYAPRDAVYYNPVSYLDGIVEKHIPGDYEFNVPEKLLELYKNKDYGQYADTNGKVPVCFLGTNHTTGGNSGSPAIDAHGNLIGLNFDRVWEGTMSDMNYDPSICRNIMVDARYILFIVDKYAGATHLIDEMKLVHPKKK